MNMVSILESVFLGILQGLTEWFPVSSSGHLVLFQNLLDIDVPIAYDIYLHLGTIFVLLAFFWNDVKAIIKDVALLRFKTKNGKTGLYIVAGCLATLIIGLLFYDFFSGFFNSLFLVGWAFIFTGILLFLSKYVKVGWKNVGFGSALLIGVAQGISLIPGVSRSGATISTGMLSGVKRIEAARFSFLLAIPAVVGAAIVDTVQNYDMMMVFIQNNIFSVALGVVFSAVVGWFSLKGLMWIIKKGGFHYFSYYCLILGILLVTKVIS